MKNVNNLVTEVKSEGMESEAFIELFNIVNEETIVPKAISFKAQLKGHVDSAVSEGYKLLIDLVQSWKGNGNFHSLYKTAYTRRLINMVKYVNRNKRRHETNYDISLSECVPTKEDEPAPILEMASEVQLHVVVDFDENVNGVPTLEELIEQFHVVHPEQAGVIDLMMGFAPDTPQTEKTNAFCAYYGVQEYTSVIQKRVSRSREAFKNFLLKNNYPISF